MPPELKRRPPICCRWNWLPGELKFGGKPYPCLRELQQVRRPRILLEDFNVDVSDLFEVVVLTARRLLRILWEKGFQHLLREVFGLRLETTWITKLLLQVRANGVRRGGCISARHVLAKASAAVWH